MHLKVCYNILAIQRRILYETRCLFQCILLHTLIIDLKSVVISVARLNIILPHVNQGFQTLKKVSTSMQQYISNSSVREEIISLHTLRHHLKILTFMRT